MFDVFGSVKGLIKLESICIDNNVFRLHYKATFIILVVASLLVTSRQYIGDPIDCIVEEIPNNVSIFLNLPNLILKYCQKNVKKTPNRLQFKFFLSSRILKKRRRS